MNKKDVEKQIEPTLLKHGFIKSIDDKFSYYNDFCSIEIQEHGYAICHNNGDVFYTNDFIIYTLIGYLIMNRFIRWID